MQFIGTIQERFCLSQEWISSIIQVINHRTCSERIATRRLRLVHPHNLINLFKFFFSTMSYTIQREPTNSISTISRGSSTITLNKLQDKCHDTTDSCQTLSESISTTREHTACRLPCINNILCSANTINDALNNINNLQHLTQQTLNVANDAINQGLNTLNNHRCLVDQTINETVNETHQSADGILNHADKLRVNITQSTQQSCNR